MPEAGGYCSTVRGSFPKASKSNPGRQHPRVTSLLARAMKEDFTGTDKTNDQGTTPHCLSEDWAVRRRSAVRLSAQEMVSNPFSFPFPFSFSLFLSFSSICFNVLLSFIGLLVVV